MGMPDIRRLDNKIDRVADKVDALKATYIKRQDDEKDSANQKAQSGRPPTAAR